MMQNRLSILPVVLLALAAASDPAWAQTTGSSSGNGRHQVRKVLAAAMADGTLSKSEEDAIDRRAEKLLAPNELPGLRQTLSRLAARKKAPPTSMPQGSAADPPAKAEHSAQAKPATLNASDTKDVTANASYQVLPGEDDLPTAEDVLPEIAGNLESPFQEESFPERTDLTDEGAAAREDGSYGMPVEFQSPYFDLWRYVSFYSTVDAFKGPLDLDGRNGNFGLRFAFNGGIPLARRFGLGVQAGTSAVMTNFQGTQFTGSSIRSQNFTTVGLFQHFMLGHRNLKWGFTYDWLDDNYYTSFALGQWRVKLGYELDPCREVGIWASIPDKGDSARLGSPATGYTVDWFKPASQGSLYYRRCWQGGVATTTWLGIADEPGQFVLGADARIPITCRLALVGNFSYILPSASGVGGQDEEMWNVSMGIELALRAGANRCESSSRYAPLFPLANNGTFAIRRF